MDCLKLDDGRKYLRNWLPFDDGMTRKKILAMRAHAASRFIIVTKWIASESTNTKNRKCFAIECFDWNHKTLLKTFSSPVVSNGMWGTLKWIEIKALLFRKLANQSLSIDARNLITIDVANWIKADRLRLFTFISKCLQWFYLFWITVWIALFKTNKFEFAKCRETLDKFK